MKNEFVKYEQAVGLKKLDYTEQCLAYYGQRKKLFPIDTDFKSFRGLGDGCLAAPLKQQVFRWFRVKYNQNSFIELVYQDGVKYDYVLYADKDEEECENFGDGPFDTYDEAEEACIDKLIEIVKQQKNDKD